MGQGEMIDISHHGVSKVSDKVFIGQWFVLVKPSVLLSNVFHCIIFQNEGNDYDLLPLMFLLPRTSLQSIDFY